MKHLNLSFAFIMILGLMTTGLQAQKGARKYQSEKEILVATKKGKIIGEKYQMLLDAFNQSFGSMYQATAVQISKGKRGVELTFTVKDEDVAFVSIDCLQQKKEGMVITMAKGKPTTVCRKGSDCTQCKIPCGCGRNGGGGSCFEEKRDGTDKIVDDFLQTVMP